MLPNVTGEAVKERAKSVTTMTQSAAIRRFGCASSGAMAMAMAMATARREERCERRHSW